MKNNILHYQVGRIMSAALFVLCSHLMIFQRMDAQPMLNFPESVEWDASTRTYLISSAATGAIVRRSANGTITPFASAGLSSSKGIVIAKFGTTPALWVADTKTLRAFNLATGAELGAFVVPNSVEINDVAADSTAGVLYISDPAAGIFRAVVSVTGNTGQATFTQIVQPDAINSPNGISFDRARNRLIVVSFAHAVPARIHAVNLQATPPTVETLATTAAGSGSLDGIARDKQGRYYVSSWDAGSIIRYDSTFTSSTVLASGFDGPADIFFNAAADTLVVPNFTRSTLDFIRISPPTISSVQSNSSKEYALALAIAPNPAHGYSTLSFRLSQPMNVSISIINTLGQVIITKDIGHQSAGDHQHLFDVRSLPSGLYSCRIQADNNVIVGTLNVIQ